MLSFSDTYRCWYNWHSADQEQQTLHRIACIAASDTVACKVKASVALRQAQLKCSPCLVEVSGKTCMQLPMTGTMAPEWASNECKQHPCTTGTDDSRFRPGPQQLHGQQQPDVKVQST